MPIRAHPQSRLLPVLSSGPRELDGRTASLLDWLRVAPVACPGARWITKADDDTYIHEDGWVAALHAIGIKRQQTACGHRIFAVSKYYQ